MQEEDDHAQGLAPGRPEQRRDGELVEGGHEDEQAARGERRGDHRQDHRAQPRQHPCPGDLSRLVELAVDQLHAGHRRPQGQRQETRQIGRQDQPQRAVEADADQGQRRQEDQDDGDGQHRARHGVGRVGERVEARAPGACGA